MSALLTLVIALASVPTTTSQAAAADLSEPAARAFADIAACAAQSPHVLAAVVVDSSGSLKKTDPSDERVGAIHTALDALQQLGTSSGGTLDVQATLATFGASYDELVGWGPVSGAHADALQASTTADLPARDNENLTDYRAALRGAQQSLDNQAATLTGTSCKIVLWFTDGRLDVDGTGLGAATDAARAEICAPQGLIDTLRGDGIAVITLALFTEGGGGSATDQDRERLKALAEASAGAETCGTTPVAASATAGAYLRANDAAAMRRLFAQAAALIAGGTPGISVACPDAVCVNGTLNIPTDRGIGGVRMVLERTPGAPAPRLVASDGQSINLTEGQTTGAGADIQVTDRDGLMTVDVTFASPGATGGSWTLISDPVTPTLIDLYYFWDVSLALESRDGLVAGETGRAQVMPRHADGSAADLSSLTTTMTVTLDGVSQQIQAVDGTWQVDIAVPATDVPPAVHIEATATATTSPSNIALGPISGRADLTTSLPPSYPTVAPATLDLPAIVGDRASTATLTFTGSDKGPTRACFADATVQAPAAAQTITVQPAQKCVDIATSATLGVDIQVQAANPADGRVDGVLPISLESVDGGDPIVVNVPFALSMTRPVNEAVRWELIALFLLGAIALSWITAEVSRRIADRYHLTTDARSAAVPVVITATGIRRANQDSDVILDPALDFEPLGLNSDQRSASFETRGLQFRRSFNWFPLAPGRAWVREQNGAIVISPARDSLTLNNEASRAPAEFPGAIGFVLIIEPNTIEATDPEIHARIVVTVDSHTGVAAVLPDRLDEIFGAPWDRIFETAQSAKIARTGHSAPAKTARENAVTAPSTVAVGFGGPPGDTRKTATATAVIPGPAIRIDDWDAEPDTTTTIEPPATRARLRRPKSSRAKPETPRSDATPPVDASGGDPPEDPPPSSTLNFWD